MESMNMEIIKHGNHKSDHQPAMGQGQPEK